MSRTFRANCGSLLNLNDSTRCGCSLCFFQIRCTVAELTFCAAAIARTLHCVASFGVVFIVASTIAASRSAEIRLVARFVDGLRESQRCHQFQIASATTARSARTWIASAPGLDL